MTSIRIRHEIDERNSILKKSRAMTERLTSKTNSLYRQRPVVSRFMSEKEMSQMKILWRKTIREKTPIKETFSYFITNGNNTRRGESSLVSHHLIFFFFFFFSDVETTIEFATYSERMRNPSSSSKQIQGRNKYWLESSSALYTCCFRFSLVDF